jgi:plastocyanin
VAVLTLLPAAAPDAAGLGSVEGKIRLTRDGKPRADHRDAVVYLEGGPAPRAPRRHAIRQRDLQFQPRVSVVVQGTTVDFPNDDKVFHNVFSTSRPARFDLGLYRSGASKAVQLKRAGVVDIFCNIHPQMASRVLVVPSILFATTDASGAFRIDGVPPGRHRFVAWHPSGGEVRGEIVAHAGRAAVITTDLPEGDGPGAHRRKDGTPYGRYE